jgi:hypothetical protein
MDTKLDWPGPSSPKTTIRGRDAYIPALLSNNSEATHASHIHTVGFRPIQNVSSGVLYFLASCSKYIHGFVSGKENVLPTIGSGNGPGGCLNSALLRYNPRVLNYTIRI